MVFQTPWTARSIRQSHVFIGLVWGSLLVFACSEDPVASEPSTTLFDSAVSEVVLEVDYETGAVPILTPRLGGTEVWGLVRTNLEALYEGSGISVVLPTGEDDAEDLGEITGEDYTVDDILGLAADRDVVDSESRRAIYVVFLDGYYSADGQRQDSVMGISLNSANLIAIFQPVLEGAGSIRFVEQTTLIHEFGHLAGLVNNGLPLVSEHHDSANGAHCTNSDCVMNYLNEGRSEMRDFIERVARDGETVVFDQACLDDARAVSP